MTGPFALVFLPDPSLGGGLDRREMARLALAAGATAVQLRAKDLPARALVGEGEALAGVCREWGRPFLVNDRVDVALACGAGGVHLGPDDMPPEAARRILGPDGLIGVSVYGPEQVREAEACGAAYVAVGAVYPTETKRIEVVGIEGVRRVRRMTALSLVAIGGITAERVEEVVLAGADGVAVVSAISASGDVEGTARLLRLRVEESLARRARLGYHGGPWAEGHA